MDCPKCYDEGKGLRQMSYRYEEKTGARVCFCNCGKEVITGFGIIA